MKVYYFEEVVKFIEALSNQDKARLERTRVLFEEYGFVIGPKYIKKIRFDLWELRSGKVRLFLFIKNDKAYGVNIFYKKSQKIPKKEIKLAIKRTINL